MSTAMESISASKCPVCGSPSENESVDPLSQIHKISCSICGEYRLTDIAISWLHNLEENEFAAKCGHYISQKQKGATCPLITEKDMEYINTRFYLPSWKELVQNLILLLGDNTKPGMPFQEKRLKKISQAVGAINLAFLLRELVNKGFVIPSGGLNNLENSLISVGGEFGEFRDRFLLTLNGWEYYEELKKGRSESNKAFMAMQFGNSKIQEAYEAFRATLNAIGFELSIVESRTGLIDDHIRVDIRNARFIIADLTNCNRGAYWEAGYAEGLGKKVIYTCEKSYFEDKDGTHFDTNHCKTILWEEANLESALQELKDIIRYEFPEVAIMEDKA